jgi:hypothetical protein
MSTTTALDATAWLSCVEPLLARQAYNWRDADKQNAHELLAAAAILVRCRAEKPEEDALSQILARAQCLAHCTEDQFMAILTFMSTHPTIGGNGQARTWCRAARDEADLTIPHRVG